MIFLRRCTNNVVGLSGGVMGYVGMNRAFYTVTDAAFFPGTLATVSSVLEFHPEVPVYVVINNKHPLTEPQRACLEVVPQIRLIDSRNLERPDRHINAWELKAYAGEELAGEFDVVIGIDSDCLLCGPVDEEIARCFESGGFLGGRDGQGAAGWLGSDCWEMR